jgi:transposase
MKITRIGLDLAKNVFQVHGVDRSERVVVRRQLSRSQVVGFFEKLEPCLIGMEACASAHHWGRVALSLNVPASLLHVFPLQNRRSPYMDGAQALFRHSFPPGALRRYC